LNWCKQTTWDLEGIIVGQKFVTQNPFMLDARIGNNNRRAMSQSLQHSRPSSHIFAACIQFRSRCCPLAERSASLWHMGTCPNSSYRVDLHSGLDSSEPVQKEKLNCLNGPSSAGVRQTCQVSIGNRGLGRIGSSGKPGLDEMCLRHQQWIGLPRRDLLLSRQFHHHPC
jgi:hypothetical protein